MVVYGGYESKKEFVDNWVGFSSTKKQEFRSLEKETIFYISLFTYTKWRFGVESATW